MGNLRRETPSQTGSTNPKSRAFWATFIGLAAGTIYAAVADVGRADSAAMPAPPPPEPRIVSIRAADEDILGRPVASAGPIAEQVTKAKATWTIPAEALDPAGAIIADGRLVHLLADGTEVTLTLDPTLQNAAVAALAKYRVAQGAIVVIRPSTGEILALAEHAEGRPDIRDTAIQSASPAASVFKIITSAAALEHANADPDAEWCTHGGHHALTLYNLKPSERRDTKCETFAEALGSSNNVAFARIADTTLKPAQLQETANKFLFNTTIPFHRAVGVSQARVPTSSRLGFARTAAGFENTTMSPLHAAMIIGAVGNGGVMMMPHLIKGARRQDEVLFESTASPLATVMTAANAATLVTMLEKTMTHGTGKKFFERKGSPRLGSYRVGGKSGSLSGRNEDGKRHYSWFVGLGAVGTGEVPDLAVAALVVQSELWTVKGAVLVREIFEAELSRTATQGASAPR